ncbi:OLC1v1008277C1 [Oldenlandia corymbosa var. corymbosa]|uniref:OLC1v1008277C1 n=1 Tax=Oldenlandia corymbosa var. corymbosa TaxID=529605 RepID=A0AAV1DL94_OLDCO|nr:OLC1v1008277C1 [Oldenlandia corymbosa var. corymbosa]
MENEMGNDEDSEEMAPGYYLEDCKELLSQMKEQEKILRLKRRWLMDLPLSAKLMKKLSPLADRTMPEIFLREDDAEFCTIKSSVQKVLGVTYSVNEGQVEDDLRSFYSNYILRNLSSLIDRMTEKGLHRFAELLGDGFVESEKTGKKFKGIIQKHLPIYLNHQNADFRTRMEEIYSLLSNHENFNENPNIFGSSTKYQVAAIRLLAGLEDLPLQALRAMRRKLNGESGHIPRLSTYKHDQKRYIIRYLKNCCMTMLSELNEGEELPQPLAKALAVASLTINLILGHPHVPEFQKFSPAMGSLQNDIATAISLLSSKYRVRSSELNVVFTKLACLEDSEVKLSKKSRRAAVINILMDFLYESSDMEIIPKPLLDAVSYVNKNSRDSDHRSVLKNTVEQEVELVLGFSAQIKQVVWDLVPELEVDNDFSDACMEHFMENDDDEEEEGMHFSRTCGLAPDDLNCSSESFGETISLNSGLLLSAGTVDGSPLFLSPDSHLRSKLQSVHITERDMFEKNNFNMSQWPESEMIEKKPIFDGTFHQSASVGMNKQSNKCSFPVESSPGDSSVPVLPGRTKLCFDVKKETTLCEPAKSAEVLRPSSPTGNKYLFVQKACDDTSMAMYHIIGGMLAELAQAQHLDLSQDSLAYLQRHRSVPDDPKDQIHGKYCLEFFLKSIPGSIDEYISFPKINIVEEGKMLVIDAVMHFSEEIKSWARSGISYPIVVLKIHTDKDLIRICEMSIESGFKDMRVYVPREGQMFGSLPGAR